MKQTKEREMERKGRERGVRVCNGEIVNLDMDRISKKKVGET